MNLLMLPEEILLKIKLLHKQLLITAFSLKSSCFNKKKFLNKMASKDFTKGYTPSFEYSVHIVSGWANFRSSIFGKKKYRTKTRKINF
jgi:hypothetical protein